MQKAITLNIGDVTGSQMGQADFDAEKEIVKAYDKPMMYYVAQDADEKIGGTVQVNNDDRHAIGLMVGKWVARGYAVNLMSYKELRKIQNKIQADIDTAEKAAKEALKSASGEQTGGAPATGGEQTGGAPAAGGEQTGDSAKNGETATASGGGKAEGDQF